MPDGNPPLGERASEGSPLAVALSPAAGRRALQEAVRRDGYAVCHGRLDDWGGEAGAEPDVREMLGPDWPRYRTAREPLVRARLLGSRRLLRYAVAVASGIEPGRVAVGRDGRGRPFLHRPAGLDVGISHTTDMLVVAVARGRRIGVDVEASDRSLLAAGLAERFCHPRELAELRGLPPAERNLRLVRLWTLKEAYTKALGVGLAHDFCRLRPRPGPRDDSWRLGRTAPGWLLRCDRVEGGFLIASALGPRDGQGDGTQEESNRVNHVSIHR
ncbi:4'-phosphopantetheinyl transferase family protein [Streptomyces sp. NPDC087903]|uniref:4'-phosphopantetheinyl transferase family protein n=1 Tax=Streptomyces sp. NPDC087903 TaxID=3365819 RepID=UPI0037FE2329